MERWTSRVVLGTILPVSLMLLGWWGTLGLLGDSPLIPWAALGGLMLGFVLDVTVLRRRLDSLLRLSTTALATIAVFYSVMIFGFFMGFPVPVLLVGLGWGYAATHTGEAGPDVRARRVRAASIGSAVIMSVACCATAWLAFNEPTIALQVRGMLGLPFTPSMSALAVMSAAGGLGLIAVAYGLPLALARWMSKESQTTYRRPSTLGR
jgi:hypothetical protein